MRHFFFFNDTATTEIYTLSLHDALPIFADHARHGGAQARQVGAAVALRDVVGEAQHLLGIAVVPLRSEEHTSELQSRLHLVCRLLLEKKKTRTPVHLVHLL